MTPYYKIRLILLQNATAILLENGTKVHYKMRRLYYKMRRYNALDIIFQRQQSNLSYLVLNVSKQFQLSAV